MKNLTVLLAILGASLSTIAQNLSYRIKENDVADIKRISIQVNPFYTEIYGGVNFATICAGLAVEVSILKQIELKGEFIIAYLDGNRGLGEVSKVTGLLHPTCNDGTNRTNYTEA